MEYRTYVGFSFEINFKLNEIPHVLKVSGAGG